MSWDQFSFVLRCGYTDILGYDPSSGDGSMSSMSSHDDDDGGRPLFLLQASRPRLQLTSMPEAAHGRIVSFLTKQELAHLMTTSMGLADTYGSRIKAVKLLVPVVERRRRGHDVTPEDKMWAGAGCGELAPVSS